MPAFNGTIAADTLVGTTGIDTITGDMGADSLSGGLGADIIYGDLAANVPPPPGPGAEILVTANSPLWQTGSGVAGDTTGGFAVVFAQSPVSPHPTLAAQSDSQIIGRLYDQAGGAVTGEFTINGAQTGNQTQPQIARLSDGNYMVIWVDESGPSNDFRDIIGQKVASDGTLIGTQFTINVIDDGSQYQPSLTALPGGGFVVTFSTYFGASQSSSIDVMASVYDNNGTVVVPEFLVNLASAGVQHESTVIPVGTAGEFAVVWASTFTNTGSASGNLFATDVYLQRFNADGSTNGFAVKVNPTHGEYDGVPTAVALANGNILVGWSRWDNTANTTDVFTEVVDPLGSTLGAFSMVNTYATDTQTAPRFAALTGGGFVMVWQSFQQDGDNNGVYAQRFDANGAKQGPEIMVHVTTGGHQMTPAVAPLANGGFVVSWDSGWYDLLDPNLMGEIRARMFDATGTPIGGGGVPGADTIDGGAGADMIYGGAGDDVLSGAGGYDTIHGEDGNDTIHGGTGFDDLVGHSGDDEIRSGFGNDTAKGGQGNDRMFGDAGNDRMIGNAGNDAMRGGIGNDTMAGSVGNDRIWGEAGHDRLTGDAGDDRLVGGGGLDNIKGGTGDDRIFGEAGADALYGNAGQDTMRGGGGGDLLLGHIGDDILIGQAGKDTLKGGAGNDKVAGDAGEDRLNGNAGDDTLNGGVGNDLLAGDTGNDRLIGGAGSDHLIGGAGRDLMSGGAGADTFIFASAGHSGTVSAGTADKITGFVAGIDTIDLQQIDAIAGGANDAFTFIGAAAFGAAGELRFAGGVLSGDTDGDGLANFEIEIAGSGLFGAADILL